MAYNFYKGKFSPINPKKYKGDPTNIIYRSRWEKKAMKYFDTNPNVLEWMSEETIVPYYDPVTARKRRYFPDFVITTKQKDGSIKTLMLEVKPMKETVEPKKKQKITRRYITEVTTWGTNQAKWEAAKAYCSKRGWEFQLITEVELNINP